MEHLKAYNQKLLANILPEHVAAHFLSTVNSDVSSLFRKFRDNFRETVVVSRLLLKFHENFPSSHRERKIQMITNGCIVRYYLTFSSLIARYKTRLLSRLITNSLVPVAYLQGDSFPGSPRKLHMTGGVLETRTDKDGNIHNAFRHFRRGEAIID